MQQINDNQLGMISDRIKAKFLPELQQIFNISKRVDEQHEWITENRNSIIKTIEEIDKLKSSDDKLVSDISALNTTVNQISTSVNTVIANIGNTDTPNSIWGFLGERSAFNAGYGDADVSAMGRKVRIKFADVPINSVIQTAGMQAFANQISKVIPGPQPYPFNGLPLDKKGKGKAKALQAIVPAPIIIDPGFNYKGTFKVEGEVDTFKFTLYELMNTRWGLSKQKSWRFFGATAKRMDDINNRIKVFAPIEGVVKDIGDKWGSFSEMHKFLSDTGVTPTQFANQVWFIKGTFKKNLETFISSLTEVPDLSKVGDLLGTSTIPINLDRLWQEDIVVSRGSKEPLAARVKRLTDGARALMSQEVDSKLGTPMFSKSLDRNLRVWESIMGIFGNLGTPLTAEDGITQLKVWDTIMDIRSRSNQNFLNIGTRTGLDLPLPTGTIFQNLAELKKKLMEFLPKLGILNMAITKIRSNTDSAKIFNQGILGKARNTRDHAKDKILGKEVVTFNMDISQWWGFTKRTATFDKTYTNSIQMLTNVFKDFKDWVEKEAEKEGGYEFSKSHDVAKVKLEFLKSFINRRMKNKMDALNRFVQKPLDLEITPGIDGVGTKLSGISTNLGELISEIGGGGSSLGQTKQRTPTTQLDPFRSRNYGQYRVDLN